MVIFLKVKIKDIAQLANVSISTVSRVINNSKPVNDDVRKRVLEAIKQTNYRSNVIGLETDRANTQLIGVIIPQNSNTVLMTSMLAFAISRICMDTTLWSD